jgi:hypothetical protein
MNRNTWLFILAVLAIAVGLVIANLSGKRIPADGAALSHKYCVSCHDYPEPGLLERDIWINGVLPEMALRMGVGDRSKLLSRFPLKEYGHFVALGVYPDSPRIPIHDWEAIVNYYRDHAPAHKIPQPKKDSVAKGGDLFTQIKIESENGIAGQTTMVRFVPARKEIWLGSRMNLLQTYNLQGKPKLSFRTPSPPVDAIVKDESIFLGIGTMMNSEYGIGTLFSMDDHGGHAKTFADSLHRPVQVVSVDVDKDGTNDLIIAEFGYVTGQVRMINGRTGDTTILSRLPGARNIHVRDVDHDGLPDLYILFAQAREQVSLFHNLGKGKFEEKVLLHFPPVYGSSYLDMADMNGDGLEDFVLSNGDNADYSFSLKPFHGVRIFLNQGDTTYHESWFYPSYGATKTIVKDFDGDGDPDMAMIAFFGETGPGNRFIYFENRGGMNFKPWDMNVPDGQWLVMEADDMDNDGDQDIILGNFQYGPDNILRPTRNIQALVLRNNHIH